MSAILQEGGGEEGVRFWSGVRVSVCVWLRCGAGWGWGREEGAPKREKFDPIFFGGDFRRMPLARAEPRRGGRTRVWGEARVMCGGSRHAARKAQMWLGRRGRRAGGRLEPAPFACAFSPAVQRLCAWEIKGALAVRWD